MPTKLHQLGARIGAVLKRVFGAFALVSGLAFSGRVLTAVVRGLTLRQAWMAGVLGLALILVGVVYLRTPLVRQ